MPVQLHASLRATDLVLTFQTAAATHSEQSKMHSDTRPSYPETPSQQHGNSLHLSLSVSKAVSSPVAKGMLQWSSVVNSAARKSSRGPASHGSLWHA
eukprot:384653-Amphidinium_carterae.1